MKLSVATVLAVVGVGAILSSFMLKKGDRIRVIAFLAGWLLPGAGHVLVGKWKKGLFFFLILGATYLFGMWIAGFRPVSFDDNPFYFVGQYGSGVTLLVAKLRGAEKAIIRDSLNPSWFDPGLLYVCVVGLLNLVVMLNLLDPRLIPNEVSVTEADVVAPPVTPPVAAAPAPDPGAAPVPEKPA